MPFLDSLDIKNRALDHLGASHIDNDAEESVNNAKISPIYDKVRRAELRRNNWRFSIRKCVLRPIDTNTYLLSPALWNAGVQYLPGSVVADATGQLWISTQTNNLANTPGQSEIWDSYFGQMTADAYDTTGATAYFAGDLVYVTKADSSYVVYMSLTNDNTEAPNVADAWSATTTYKQDEVVTRSGTQWRSLIAMNLNNTPANGPANWVATQSYSSSNTVTGSDGYKYTSVTNSNVGNDPTLDSGTNWTNSGVPTAWTSSPLTPVTSSIWVAIYASLQTINIVYPLGSGPLSQAFSRNIFRLPAGYLRQVVSSPKQGINSFLGAPSGRQLNDWEFEGNYILSQQSTPIILRFVADVQNVTAMDDMFCEGLAARVAVEGCEAITNSTAKMQTCINVYKTTMGEARIVNAVEIGPVTPPEDDYVTCRV